MNALCRLEQRILTITRLGQIQALLDWDQQCYMPEGASGARASQLETLARVIHDAWQSPETRALLDEASALPLDQDSDAALSLRAIRRDFERETKLPERLVAALSRETSLAHDVWVRARRDRRFADFAPSLERLVALSQEVASCLGYASHPYDALLDRYEPGVTTREVDKVFSDLCPEVSALLAEVQARPQVDSSFLARHYPVDAQERFASLIATAMGFDKTCGRLDVAVHPFCTSFGRTDVRTTTRYDPEYLPTALMGVIHETGHALYEQGIDEGDEESPLGTYASMAIHESQSRLWENLVCRARPFWQHFFGPLRDHFPDALAGVTCDAFVAGMNRIEPSHIRVEADELSYHLHIALRFRLEKDLISGALAVRDAPDAWNELSRSLLGITPDHASLGILQDVHWATGSFGYFPTYTLGSLLASQLFERAREELPGLEEQFARGELLPLRQWLRERIHRHGRRYYPKELIVRATGAPLSAEPFLRHVRRKVEEFYG